MTPYRRPDPECPHYTRERVSNSLATGSACTRCQGWVWLRLKPPGHSEGAVCQQRPASRSAPDSSHEVQEALWAE